MNRLLTGVLAALASSALAAAGPAATWASAASGVVGPTAAATAPAGGCRVSAPPAEGDFPILLSTPLVGGAVLIGSSHILHNQSVTLLSLVSAGCQPSRAFGQGGTATIRLGVPSGSAGITAVAAAPGGGVLLAGGAGTNVIVGRVRANGALDKAFGNGGWAHLRPPEHPPNGMAPQPTVGSLLVGPTGSIYVGGDDGVAHCCVEDFVAALTPRGQPATGFGNHGWANVPSLAGSYSTELFSTGSGLLVMGFVMYTGCGGPVLARLSWAGHLVPSFATAAQQWLETAEPRYALISPAWFPRPGGRFAIASALMPSGCTSHMAKNVNTGLVIGFLPDGNRDPSFGTGGRTSFPAAGSSQVLVVPRRGGSAFLVSERVGGSSAAEPSRGLEIREISPTGQLVGSYGRGGATEINLDWAQAPGLYPAVAGFPGPGGSALLVVAAKGTAKMYKLTP